MAAGLGTRRGYRRPVLPSADLDTLLGPLRSNPARSGVLCDFDGTLSPIVDNPDGARPLDGIVEALHGLATRYRQVAIISGRPVSFLVDHLDVASEPRLHLAGIYGLEEVVDGRVVSPPEAPRWRAAAAAVADAADREAPLNVLVERKGLAVAIHYRTAPSAAEWVRAFASAQATANGLVAHHGKMHVELRPPFEVDKGTIVTRLAAGLEAVCFLGDDVGDLPAFAALDRLAAAGVHCVKVASTGAEVVPEVHAAADVVVDGPEGSLDVLRRLLR